MSPSFSPWEIAPGAPLASETDPVTFGVMKGFPPRDDKRIVASGAGPLGFPAGRWTYNHWQELYPTRRIWRGTALPRRFEEEPRDFTNLRFTLIDGTETTFLQAIDQMYVDGLLILHRGKAVYETYRAEGRPERPHLAWSVTKSIVGTVAAALISDGRLGADDLVIDHIPELTDSAFGDATLRHVLDMTVAADFSENYGDPNANIRDYGYALGFGEDPGPYYRGPRDLGSYLRTVQKVGEHGQTFRYMTITTEVLTWIVTRVTQKSLSELFSEMIWTRIGAEEDAYIHLDPIGTEAGGMGLNTTLRDLARFGEMIRNRGTFGGTRILSNQVFDELLKPAQLSERQAFASSTYANVLPGWTYHDMWWFRNNPNQAFTARGIYGQCIYVDPVVEMVIARYASMPAAGNVANDPVSLPFYDAVARELVGSF